MQQTSEVIAHWITTIQEEGIGLTKWEEEFVQSIHDQMGGARAHLRAATGDPLTDLCGEDAVRFV
jgi:hypothetical protein